MTEVTISIKAKVGAASVEIESSPGDILHHITGPDFMKQLLDLAGFVAPPDAEVEEPTTFGSGQGGPPYEDHKDDPDDNPASMGSVDSFLTKGGRRTDIGDGQTMEEEAILTPGSGDADKPHKTFGNRVEYDDSVEGQKSRAGAERLHDADGWAST